MKGDGMEWYYVSGGRQQGPVTEETLRQMISAGQITAADSVWRQGMLQWTPAGQVPGLIGPPPVTPEGSQVPPGPPGGRTYAAPVTAPTQSTFSTAVTTTVTVPPKTAGLAVATLVLGCCAIIPFVGIMPGMIAVLVGAIALAVGTAKKGMAIAGMVIGLLLSGLWIVLMFVLPMMAFLVAPFIGEKILEQSNAVSQDNSAGCKTNLNAISIGIQAYRVRHQRAFPPTLAAVEKDGMFPKMPVCPTSNTAYFYCAPQSDEPQEDSIIACDLHSVHSNERNYLMADGSVHEANDFDFRSLLSQQENAKFQAALRKAGGL